VNLRLPKRLTNFLLAITSCAIFAFGLFWATIAFGCFERNPWYRLYLLTGESMESVIHPDDVVIISPQTEGLEPGMIISFPSPDGPNFILHRIVAITEEGCYLTKGDNNQDVDDWKVCQVTGRYAGKVPYLGKSVRLWREFLEPPQN